MRVAALPWPRLAFPAEAIPGLGFQPDFGTSWLPWPATLPHPAPAPGVTGGFHPLRFLLPLSCRISSEPCSSKWSEPANPAVTPISPWLKKVSFPFPGGRLRVCPHLTEHLTLSLSTGRPRPPHPRPVSVQGPDRVPCSRAVVYPVWLGAEVGSRWVCISLPGAHLREAPAAICPEPTLMETGCRVLVEGDHYPGHLPVAPLIPLSVGPQGPLLVAQNRPEAKHEKSGKDRR